MIRWTIFPWLTGLIISDMSPVQRITVGIIPLWLDNQAEHQSWGANDLSAPVVHISLSILKDDLF